MDRYRAIYKCRLCGKEIESIKNIEGSDKEIAKLSIDIIKGANSYFSPYELCYGEHDEIGVSGFCGFRKVK